MVKIITTLCLLLALVVLPNIVSAGPIAGESATLITANAQELQTSSYAERSLQREVIREILSSRKSPLEAEVNGFMDACIAHDIDCYLLPSIAGLESSFGRFIHPNSHNPFGWGGGYIMFDTWSDGFQAVAFGLKKTIWVVALQRFKKLVLYTLQVPHGPFELSLYTTSL